MDITDQPDDDLLPRDFRELSPSETAEVLEWRNDESIRSQMNNPEVITPAQHKAFIEGLGDDDRRLYYRVDRSGEGIGVVNLTEIDRQNASAELGIYRAPGKGRLGDGKRLMKLLERLARAEGLQQIQLKVRTDNMRAISLYESLDYDVYDQDETYQYRKKRIV